MKFSLGEKFSEKFRELEFFYAGTGLKFSFKTFILLLFVIALAAFFTLLFLRLPLITSTIAFFALMSLVVTIPINMRNARIAALNDSLPDALRHMALVLKAGGTTEVALSEASRAGYGPLSAELSVALKELREGKSFDDVLRSQSRKSGSLLFERTALIIIDARRAGAGIADVMTQIAEDARDVSHIRRERYSRTTMHVIFLLVSSLLLAPFIFGFSISLVNYINQGIAGALPQAPRTNLCDLNSLLIIFLAIQAIIASLAIGIIREGKMIKYILYTPLMVLCSLLVYEAGKHISLAIVGGIALVC